MMMRYGMLPGRESRPTLRLITTVRTPDPGFGAMRLAGCISSSPQRMGTKISIIVPMAFIGGGRRRLERSYLPRVISESALKDAERYLGLCSNVRTVRSKAV